MRLADDLPAAGPRRLARGTKGLAVDALDVHLVRVAGLLADDPNRLSDIRLERMLVAVEPRWPRFERVCRAAAPKGVDRHAICIGGGPDRASQGDRRLGTLVLAARVLRVAGA